MHEGFLCASTGGFIFLPCFLQVVHEIRNYPYPQLQLLALQGLNPSRHTSAVRESYEVCILGTGIITFSNPGNPCKHWHKLIRPCLLAWESQMRTGLNLQQLIITKKTKLLSGFGERWSTPCAWVWLPSLATKCPVLCFIDWLIDWLMIDFSKLTNELHPDFLTTGYPAFSSVPWSLDGWPKSQNSDLSSNYNWSGFSRHFHQGQGRMEPCFLAVGWWNFAFFHWCFFAICFSVLQELLQLEDRLGSVSRGAVQNTIERFTFPHKYKKVRALKWPPDPLGWPSAVCVECSEGRTLVGCNPQHWQTNTTS